MKSKFADSCINYLKNNNACKEEEETKFKYVLESLFSYFTKITVVLLISFYTQTFNITIVTLLLYSVLRGFCFGIHASKNIYCWIITIFVYLAVPIAIKYLSFNTSLIISIYIIGFITICLYAPADTPSRPLINAKKRLMNKIISLVYMGIVTYLAFFFKNVILEEIVALVLLVNAVCINPLTYKIFKIPYNNYKYYKS